MKRSSTVRVTLLASVAAACGCSDTVTHCVDATNRVVADSLCAGMAVSDSGVRPSGVQVIHPYRFYYGGSAGGFGTVVTGGSFSPPEGEASVSHGGFGESGEAHGGSSGE